MTRKYIWPACVAAAAHVALLFGFPKSVRPDLPPADSRDHPGDAFPAPPPPEDILELIQPDPDAPRSADRPVERPIAAVGGELDRSLPVITPPTVPANPGSIETWRSIPAGGSLWPDRPGIGLPRDGVYLGGELDRTPATRLQTAPLYPPEARRDGRTGVVVVEFVVDETGAVLAPRVANSTDRLFEEAALRAVAKWRFEPGRRHGAVVRFRMAVPIHFSLHE